LRATGLTGDREKQLLKQIADGNAQALSALYDMYHLVLFRQLLGIVKQREEAEDLLQEVFNQIWSKAGSFDPDRGSVYTWMTTMSRNKGLDFLRSKAHKRSQKTDYDPEEFILSGIPASDETPLDQTILSERSHLLKLALQQIPEEQQQVLKIAYFDGYSQSEIADQLGLPLGTIKTRMRQGMIKLESILSKVMR
jgi:RNA polymerase sigma-70 factor (ECF subfamily)